MTKQTVSKKVQGEIDCSGLRLTGATPIVGSEFPTHRVFVDGVAKGTVRQGVFSNLWVSDPADSSLVK